MNHILVDLDAILDTRMGVISHMGDWSNKLAACKDYFTRVNDKFDKIITGFPQEEFEKRYKERNYSSIAGRVYMTPIVERLNVHFRAAMSAEFGGAEGIATKLALNIYPYAIPEKDKKEFASILKNVTFAKEVSVVSHDVLTLTPKFIKKNYQKYITYDFDLWLQHHIMELERAPMPAVEVLHPFILRNKPGEKISTLVSSIKNFYRPCFDLELLPLEKFSFTVPKEILDDGEG